MSFEFVMFVRVFAVITALVASPVPIGLAAETDGEFLQNSRPFPLDLTSTRIGSPTCVDIPADLSLCQNIGYSQMRMPNLLDHDTLEEVKHQAQSWVPLLLQRCHEDTQLFLCALFAPVCLDRPIYPCRSLCEEVRAGCAPVMESNCFPWPDMLDCEKFPPDNDLCIKSEMREQNGTGGSQAFEISSAMQEQFMILFTQCHTDSTQETLVQKYCTSDFVLKVKIKTIREGKDGKKYIGDSNPEKLDIIKRGSLKGKDLKRLTFYVREGANCRCNMLEESGNYLLIMGHRDNRRSKSKKLIMTFVHSWEKTRNFRRSLKAMDAPDACAERVLEVEGNTPQNAQVSEPLEMTPNAQPMADQTNTPVNDGVSPADQVMNDETPSPPRKNSKRGNRERNRERKRDRGQKQRNRPNREIPVRRN